MLTEDLHNILEALDLGDVTLVAFSMGGGEVGRYFSLYGTERLHSVVFASAVPPDLMQSPGKPNGPLTLVDATKMTAALTADQDSLYDDLSTQFFSADGALKVAEQLRQDALGLCEQAALA